METPKGISYTGKQFGTPVKKFGTSFKEAPRKSVDITNYRQNISITSDFSSGKLFNEQPDATISDITYNKHDSNCYDTQSLSNNCLSDLSRSAISKCNVISTELKNIQHKAVYKIIASILTTFTFLAIGIFLPHVASIICFGIAAALFVATLIYITYILYITRAISISHHEINAKIVNINNNIINKNNLLSHFEYNTEKFIFIDNYCNPIMHFLEATLTPLTI